MSAKSTLTSISRNRLTLPPPPPPRLSGHQTAPRRIAALIALGLLLATVAGLSGAGEVAAQGRSYARGNSLIDVANLAQLDAIRYDLNGNGLQDSASAEDWAKHQAAFPGARTGMGCTPAPCTGYELTASLDFDENGDGTVGPMYDPTYWNEGNGWIPIGQDPGYTANTVAYSATFEGNGHTISHLYIKRDINNNLEHMHSGLFGRATGALRNVGMVNPYVSIRRSGTSTTATLADRFNDVGSLVGNMTGPGHSVTGSWVDGGGVSLTFVDGGGTATDGGVGCLVGRSDGNIGNFGTFTSNGANCAVNARSTLDHTSTTLNTGTGDLDNADNNLLFAGGLIGRITRWSDITASYARGNVTCRGNGSKGCAGLTGKTALAGIYSSYATGNVVNEAFFGPKSDTSGCRHNYGNNFTAGLVGNNESYRGGPPNYLGRVTDSYAAGSITSTTPRDHLCTIGSWANQAAFPPIVSGLLSQTDVGSTRPVVTASYWDTTTGYPTSEEGTGRSTVQLQTPTDYTGIYANWDDRDLDGDGNNDDPWDFRTSTEYPILTYGHGEQSMAIQRAPEPTATEYEPSDQERFVAEDDDDEEDREYVAPPIVYNLNIRFSVKGITLDEGESATYQVRMSQSPVGHPARVRIHSNNPDVVVSPTELTFSSTNYSQWQRVKVTTLRDPNDTDESASLAHRGPNLGYGAIIVSVNDTWPGAAVETVNGHTLTLRHTLDAPYGVTVTAPDTLDANTDITIAGAPAGTPLGAPGYGLGAAAAARMLAAIRVEGTPADGLTICLPVPEALLAEAGGRPLALLRYAEGRWAPVAGAARRDDADGAARLCAAGVTEYGAFAVAYALPALGAVSDLAATAGDDAGTITLTWTPGANAERHWVAGVKDSDRSKLAVWGAADAMGSHSVSDLEAGAAYIFTVTAGRGEGAAREWSAWATWATATAPAPTPTPTPAINPPNSPFPR